MSDTISMKIAGRVISSDTPCFLIAEVAQAHDGSLGVAHSYVDLATEVGADAVKFQTHIADAETTPLEPFRTKFSYEDETRFDYWKRMEFTPEQWSGLFDHARDKGLIPLSSAFSHEAFELLERLDMPAWKVASGEIGNESFLELMAKTGKPMLLSSGMSPPGEIDGAVSIMRAHASPFALFQCASKYPTPLTDIGLNVLDEMRRTYDCPVGLSDHSGQPYPSLAAMALGADIIEVHICFDKNQFGPDTTSSLTPEQFKLVSEARDAFHVMRQHPVDKEAAAAELGEMRRLFTKSLALRQSMPAGSVLTEDILTVKKPGTGISVSRYEEFLGKHLVRDVDSSQLLSEADVEGTD